MVEKVTNGSDANQAEGKDGKEAASKDAELIVVETDENGKPLGQAADATDDAGSESDAGADATDEDERVGHSESDDEVEGETVEERRARRKKERQARNVKRRSTGQAKDRQIEQLLAERQEMSDRIAAIEGRNVRYDVNNLNEKLAQINSQLTQARDTMATCVKAGDGDGVAEVTEIQYALRDQKRQIEFALQRAQQQTQQSQQAQTKQAETPQLPAAAVTQAVAFAGSHKWYDPKGSDQDSLIVQALDNAVFSEGFNPETAEYWEELEDRVREQLPHRFKTRAKPNQQADEPAARSSGPRMASSSGTANGNGRRLGRNEVYVSPERKSAMQAAGAWDDPKKRAKLLARYAEADREAASARH